MVSSAFSSVINNSEISSWLEFTISKLSPDDSQLLTQSLDYSIQLYADHCLSTGEKVIPHILGTVATLIMLKVDSDTLAAGTLHAVPDYLDDYIKKLQTDFNPTVVHLIEGVTRMGRFRIIDITDKASNHVTQIEALRKMLLAMAEDIRVVIIALASRVQTMRYVIANNIHERVGLAHETLDIFAPLANRLGLWQVKWELEDLSFRILEPERYKKIALLLEETRSSREKYIALVVTKLQHELQQAGIKAEITGRPKHIYSIHKKMKRKDLDFSEIYDARAVRILVDDVQNCYAALGIAHNLWVPIPKEFDDYIAKPKSNDYRSLHTAVCGPENKVVEIQIRTYEMHRHSELGVAAHWRYKEGAKRDARYEEKIAWLRQILEWKNDISDSGELATHFKTALFEDSIYVLTPQDRVIALPKGSTPVDFAYHVHTDLGHRCRGAKVDGTMVSLDYSLQNAQRVEIISAKQGGPSRDWINLGLNYLKSHRARLKVKQWFKNQESKTALAQGRVIVEKELQRRGPITMSLDKFANKFNFNRLSDFFIAVAKGDVTHYQLRTALNNKIESTATRLDLLTDRKTTASPASQQTGTGILIVGVDKLLTVLAKCCKPAPPDPIIGFVSTRGRGIIIHRQGCNSLGQLSNEHLNRLVEADWGSSKNNSYPVDVVIKAHDRQWLLRDISDILSHEKINVVTINTHKRQAITTIRLTLEVSEITQLQRVLGLIKGIPGVMLTTRR
ncbi:GTP pyrophosphokinase [Nitrosomonas cryotolerans]|uniref:GTP pyrophosphokinase n=1 Tax=Nitrosomonas cryotolerans ATCC 49181 TaxID=1131553 RepID=A0A1N6ISZ5_9PROT|nr:bifunctional (p)ppGpp synthetase/guanosine-3',5'-bis(diphosphate) 3'-pyrophosphohydrolase [Nitrosomonas cryotolerans]SFP32992.1 GTP pyrophosphokinase [Nitrosomonas cryotolerans]SIO35152.1 GTP pyrophosphokinase [Nitrosomonas cryotolerans ATCC 49181]